MKVTPALAYEILQSIVAKDTVLILYDLEGVEERMLVNLLSLKTVFGLERSRLPCPKDKEGLYRIRIDERCNPAFIFGLNLAYHRLSHQGDPSLIRCSQETDDQEIVASLSLRAVKKVLHFAEVYRMRGVYEEMKRLICNDTYLQLRGGNDWEGPDIQRFFASDGNRSTNPTEGGKGFQQFVAGLSAYEKGIYLVHLEASLRLREHKDAQIARYHASLEDTTDREGDCGEPIAQKSVRWCSTVDSPPCVS